MRSQTDILDEKDLVGLSMQMGPTGWSSLPLLETEQINYLLVNQQPIFMWQLAESVFFNLRVKYRQLLASTCEK